MLDAFRKIMFRVIISSLPIVVFVWTFYYHDTVCNIKPKLQIIQSCFSSHKYIIIFLINCTNHKFIKQINKIKKIKVQYRTDRM